MKIRGLLVDTVALVRVDDGLTEPMLYLVLRFLRRLRAVENVNDSSLLAVSYRRRIYRKIAADRAHIGCIRKRRTRELAYHIDGMRPLHDHAHERRRDHIIQKPLANHAAENFRI